MGPPAPAPERRAGRPPAKTAVYGAAALPDRLAARYRLGRTPVQVGGRSWSVLGPADPDSLIDAIQPNDDDRLPYWAQLWPAGQVLAEAVLTTDALAGQRVLELGCGLGLTAAAALVAGADLLAVDCEPDALAFAAYNVRALAGVSLVTKLGNWRGPAPGAWLEPPYDVVLAADVLYERRDVAAARHARAPAAGAGRLALAGRAATRGRWPLRGAAVRGRVGRCRPIGAVRRPGTAARR